MDIRNESSAALKALADEGTIAKSKVSEAIEKYGVNAPKAVPWAARV